MKTNQNILFFDGACNLCNGFVDFMISRDKKRKFHVASLQGQTAQRLLSLEEIEKCSSVILVNPDGEKLVKSAAVFKVLSGLGGVYWLLSYLRVLPTSLTDWFYDQVAANRYKLFGRKALCRVPTEEEKSYFLD